MTNNLKSRCDARQAADAALQLLTEAITGDAEHFWRIVRDHAVQQLPRTPKDAGPMTDGETVAFGRKMMPYGKYMGVRVNEVPVGYLDWLVGESDDLKTQLKRYLLNDAVRARVVDEIGWDD